MLTKILEFFISKVVYKSIEQLAIVLPQLIIDWAEKRKKEKEQEKAKEEFNNAKNSNEASEDEVIKKHQDFINSGNSH